jgi:hypothetical protein
LNERILISVAFRRYWSIPITSWSTRLFLLWSALLPFRTIMSLVAWVWTIFGSQGFIN